MLNRKETQTDELKNIYLKTRVPQSLYDDIHKKALNEGICISDVVRRAIRNELYLKRGDN